MIPPPADLPPPELEKGYYIKESPRIGLSLLTFFKIESEGYERPLGSLLFNPDEDKEEIKECYDLIARWESIRREKIKAESSRRDERESKRNHRTIKR